MSRSWRAIDPWLAAVLVAATFFCVRGIGWGRVEDWNRDQMAMRDLQGLRPFFFQKPPFLTYLDHAVVLLPIAAAETATARMTGVPQHWNHAQLIGSRFLVLGLFLGTIGLGYVISLRFFGLFAARVSALFLGTSAGFVTFAHFLSCDSPLLFFLFATLFFAQRIMRYGHMRDYVFAGLLAGLATATKYNGLAAGILIPVAHWLSPNCVSLRRALFDPRVILSVLMVPIGFLLGNPYALIEWNRFVGDFMYNYEVTPAYGGQHGHGYNAFLRRFPEILGWPGAIACWIMALGSLALVVRRKRPHWDEVAGFILIGSFFLLYYLKIGNFARMPTRFVLPAVPFALLLAGPILATAHRWRRWICVVLGMIFAYNVVCSFMVGRRFATDPRLAAQDWMLAHVQPGAVVESSSRSPRWSLLSDLHLMEFKATDPNLRKVKPGVGVDLRMPAVNGRSQLFGRIFKGNRWVEAGRHEEGDPDEQMFTLPALRQRNPDFITIYEPDAVMPSEVARNYYAQLRADRFPYEVRFDGALPPVSRLIYPKTIDFLDGRITILARPQPK